MSKKYKNPVTKHFVYNEETRKSTCKKCLFDMAGRHSENLMRHLKRKHIDTYEEVFAEKMRIRELACQEETEADEATKPYYTNTYRWQKSSATSVSTTNLMDDQAGDDGGDNVDTASVQYDDIFIVKSELQDPNDDENESRFGDKDSLDQVAGTSRDRTAASSSTSASRVAPLSSDDDTFFLQYLANKMSKYSDRTKNTVQYQINKILYKADMGCFENADADI